MKAKQPAKKQTTLGQLKESPVIEQLRLFSATILERIYALERGEAPISIRIESALTDIESRLVLLERNPTTVPPMPEQIERAINEAVGIRMSDFPHCHRFGHKLVAMNPGEHPICERCGLTLRAINPKYDEQVGGEPESVAHAVVASWQEQAMQHNTGK